MTFTEKDTHAFVHNITPEYSAHKTLETGRNRLKSYKSPATLRRNTKSLLQYLHKLIIAKRKNSGNMIEDTSNTFHQNPGNFLTTTPRRLWRMCEECKQGCAAKFHLENHKNPEFALGHGQVALSTSSIVM